MDNGAEKDRERDGSTSSSTTWRTCSSTWRMLRIELNGEGEPVWLTPHLRDPQREGEREREREDRTFAIRSAFNIVSAKQRRPYFSWPLTYCLTNGAKPVLVADNLNLSL